MMTVIAITLTPRANNMSINYAAACKVDYYRAMRP